MLEGLGGYKDSASLAEDVKEKLIKAEAEEAARNTLKEAEEAEKRAQREAKFEAYEAKVGFITLLVKVSPR